MTEPIDQPNDEELSDKPISVLSDKKPAEEANSKVYVEWPEEMDDEQFRFVESRIGDLEINSDFDVKTARVKDSNSHDSNSVSENSNNLNHKMSNQIDSNPPKNIQEHSGESFGKPNSQGKHIDSADNGGRKQFEPTQVEQSAMEPTIKSYGTKAEPGDSETRTKSNVPPLDLLSRSSSLDLAGAKGSLDINLRSDSEDEETEKFEPQDSLEFLESLEPRKNSNPSLKENPAVVNQYDYNPVAPPPNMSDLQIHKDFYDTGRNPPDSNNYTSERSYPEGKPSGAYRGDLMRMTKKDINYDYNGGYHGGGVITQPSGQYNYQPVNHAMPVYDSASNVQIINQMQGPPPPPPPSSPPIHSYLMDYENNNNNFPKSGFSETDNEILQSPQQANQYAKLTPSGSEKRQESNSAPPQVWNNVKMRHHNLADQSKLYPNNSKNFIEANKDAIQRGVINSSYATNSSYNRLYTYNKKVNSKNKPMTNSSKPSQPNPASSSVATDSGKYRIPTTSQQMVSEDNRTDMSRPSQQTFPRDEFSKPNSGASNQMIPNKPSLFGLVNNPHQFESHSYPINYNPIRPSAYSSHSPVHEPHSYPIMPGHNYSGERFDHISEDQLNTQYQSDNAIVHAPNISNYSSNHQHRRSHEQVIHDEIQWRKINEEFAARSSRRHDPRHTEREYTEPASPTNIPRGGHPHHKMEAIPRYSPLPPIQSPKQESIHEKLASQDQEQGSYMKKFLREKEGSPPRYQRYTLKDFQNFQNFNKMGGLGPNVDTEDYKFKREKFHRQRDYAQKVLEMNRTQIQKSYRQVQRESSLSPKRISEPSLVQPAWVDPKLNPPGKDSPHKLLVDMDDKSAKDFPPDIIEIMSRPTKRQMMQNYSKSLRKAKAPRAKESNKKQTRFKEDSSSKDKPNHPQVFTNEQLDKLLMRHEDDKRNVEVIRQAVSKA